MSTASPLPLPLNTVSEEESRALKREIASRLAEHRQRRGRTTPQAALPLEMPQGHRSSVANSVAARFARSVSYSDYLKQEAEAAIRQAAAQAEVARRNAEAIAAAQQQLLEELEQWNAAAEPEQHNGPAEVIAFAAPADADHAGLAGSETAVASAFMAATEWVEATAPSSNKAVASAATQSVVSNVAAVAANKAPRILAVESEVSAAIPAVDAASSTDAAKDFAQIFTAAVNELGERPLSLAERLGLSTEPAEPAVPLPTNLIEFPRQLVASRKARPRLAEGPLREETDASPERAQLRIFEVEASSLSTQPVMESVLPEWHTIRLDVDTSAHAEQPDAQISFALPLYVAPAGRRVMAFLVDASCVFAAYLMAVVAAASVSPALPTGIPALLVSAVMLFAFAIGYQLLFFSLNGSTPGMHYARIGLCTFNDENPTRSAMRQRIFALLLAGMPLGLGFIWACMDEENLGWHDRISRMYPRAY